VHTNCTIPVLCIAVHAHKLHMCRLCGTYSTWIGLAWLHTIFASYSPKEHSYVQYMCQKHSVSNGDRQAGTRKSCSWQATVPNIPILDASSYQRFFVAHVCNYFCTHAKEFFGLFLHSYQNSPLSHRHLHVHDMQCHVLTCDRVILYTSL
jgi:hypothetical protein